jgi:hypothetical protein
MPSALTVRPSSFFADYFELNPFLISGAFVEEKIKD